MISLVLGIPPSCFPFHSSWLCCHSVSKFLITITKSWTYSLQVFIINNRGCESDCSNAKKKKKKLCIKTKLQLTWPEVATCFGTTEATPLFSPRCSCHCRLALFCVLWSLIASFFLLAEVLHSIQPAVVPFYLLDCIYWFLVQSF